MALSDSGDKRLAFLVALVREAGRKTGVGVAPEDVGKKLGLTEDEVDEFEDYWTGHGRLEGCTQDYVSITVAAIDDVDDHEANGLMAGLRELYVEHAYPNHRTWRFSPDSPQQVRLFSRLCARGDIEQFTHGNWRLTNAGVDRIMNTPALAATALVSVHHGDIVYGAKTTSTITDSTVGAVAVGAQASATQSISQEPTVSREQLRSAISEAQRALVSDQDSLDQIDERIYEALNQFLRIARSIEVEQKSLADVQRKMQETLDEVWAAQVAQGMKPAVLPEALQVIQTFLKNPLTLELGKHLVGGV